MARAGRLRGEGSWCDGGTHFSLAHGTEPGTSGLDDAPRYPAGLMVISDRRWRMMKPGGRGGGGEGGAGGRGGKYTTRGPQSEQSRPYAHVPGSCERMPPSSQTPFLAVGHMSKHASGGGGGLNDVGGGEGGGGGWGDRM